MVSVEKNINIVRDAIQKQAVSARTWDRKFIDLMLEGTFQLPKALHREAPCFDGVNISY